MKQTTIIIEEQYGRDKEKIAGKVVKTHKNIYIYIYIYLCVLILAYLK